MSPHPSEEQLALYAGDDLDARSAAQVREHVGNCEMCRGSLAAFAGLQSILVELLPEPADRELQLLREQVALRIARDHRANRHVLRWASLAAAAVAIAFVLVIDRKRPVPAPLPEPITLRSAPLPAFQMPAIAYTPPARRPRIKPAEAGLRAVTWTTRPDGSAQLRLTTADPNVVILFALSEPSDKHEN